MEKTLQLVECSFKKQRDWTRQDGTKETVDYYEVTLTDGIDTIHGETSGPLTKQIVKDGEDKLRLIEGHWYAVRVTINARKYDKDGKSGRFVSVIVHQMMLMS